jgi:hypothetical protein
MKKTILLLATGVLLVTFNANAQIGFGVKAGLNFNSASIDAASGGASASDVASTSTGYHFGVFSVIKLGPIGIQPEVYYSVQGMDISVNGAKQAVTSNYVQIPILARLSFLKIINIHAGPQFGISTKKEIKEIATGSVTDLKDLTKGADIAIVAGVGLNLPMGINASFRYVQTLNDIADGASLGGGYNLDTWKNAMFQLSVGYTLFGND